MFNQNITDITTNNSNEYLHYILVHKQRTITRNKTVHLSKTRRPISNVAECGVWSESMLFAIQPGGSQTDLFEF